LGLTQDTIQTIQWRASYMVRPMNGLRIISLNTIYAYTDNFWLLVNDTDPDGTLNWLVQQLTAAESANDKVWIIGHISNDQTTSSWSRNFYNIVNRFESTIRGQFYGHTHFDQFNIFYDSGAPSGRPTAFEFIAPSLTTYSAVNPSYRMYTIDGDHAGTTWSVMDSQTYMLNLTKANAGQTPVWELEYSAKSAFGMQSLTPSDWHSLTQRMNSDVTLVEKYNSYYARTAFPGPYCDASCVRNTICNLQKARTDMICASSTPANKDVFSSARISELLVATNTANAAAKGVCPPSVIQ
jgi:sphingomyelin phosphodiesterase